MVILEPSSQEELWSMYVLLDLGIANDVASRSLVEEGLAIVDADNVLIRCKVWHVVVSKAITDDGGGSTWRPTRFSNWP